MKQVVIPPALEQVVQQTVPQWPERLRRRWLVEFLPHWRVDLVDEARLARLLAIAMRRGWFDESVGAKRWTVFVEIAQKAVKARGALGAAATVNLFNFVAVLPSISEGLVERLDARAWGLLVASGAVIDAPTLSALVAEHTPKIQRAQLTSPILRVIDGAAVHARGRAWLERWDRGSDWELAYLIEPFGSKAWDGVSEVGLDAGVLTAYSRPLGLVARLHLPDFPVDVVRGQPGKLKRPKVKKSAVAGIWETFAWENKTRVGLTDDGAVAVLAPIKKG